MREPVDELVRRLDRVHHFLDARFAQHDVPYHLLLRNAALGGLGRDLVESQGGLDKGGADSEGADLALALG
jgi:hypothetical protein